MKISIYAPATSANINVGFDSLGVAISPVDGSLLGDVVTIEDYDQTFACENVGEFAKYLPQNNDDNLVVKAYHLFKEQASKKNIRLKNLKLTLSKNMPIGSGLGSSACSIVATLVALNKFHNNPFDNNKLLTMMGILEGSVSGSVHYDNVAPSFLGKMQLMAETKNSICKEIPFFSSYWVMAYSGIEVSTKIAREILPSHYQKSDIISQANNFASFILGCFTKDDILAYKKMTDLIAEPYRKDLLPNFDKVKEQALKQGARAFGISGSGPSVFAICDDFETACNLEKLLKQDYLQNENGFVKICNIDTQGAREI